MAMRLTFLLLLGSPFALVGCAAHPELVEDLPPPNFNGPTIAAPTARPQSAPPVAQAPSARRPAPQASANVGGVPRDWLPQGGARSWKWIVIHHSATPAGSARSFDRMHRDNGWDELGYHFVIGNGTDSADGQIEVGPRWPKQKWGAHAKTADNRFNDYGIGVCLVGNFDVERPTPQQTKALAKLVAHLMKTYNVPANRVLGHGDTGKPTECPGRNMNVASIRRMAAQIAAGGEVAGDDTQVAGSYNVDGDALDLNAAADRAGGADELLNPTAGAAALQAATEP